MRNFLALIFTGLTYLSLASGEVPSVPANVTIAEVKLKITPGAQREIQKDINAIRASEKYFQLKLDRVNLYFPIIERVLKEEGVPEDIKYLSIQESALVSDAVSSAGAVGYWQFKDFTAREVGLRVDSKIDERKNIVAASRGAAKYFKRNNFYVKNWIYAVNAYMTGPGGVKPYVNQKDVGASSMVISEKTHWYVKRFIAHVLAYRDEVGGPHSEGLKLVEYEKGKNKSLEQIAAELKVDDDDVKEYNKWLKFGKIPDDKDYIVIVPIKGRVPANLKDAGSSDGPPPLTRRIEEPREKTKRNYSTSNKNVFIKRNNRRAIMATERDNVTTLAMKANILSRQLMKFNDLRPHQTIENGEIYYAQRKRNRADIDFHMTRNGETLWDISQKYGVKLDKVLKMNRMESQSELKVGRILWLSKKRPKDHPVEYGNVKTVTPVKTKKIQTTPPVVDIPDEIKETPKVVVPEPEIEIEEEPIKEEKPVSPSPSSAAGKVHIVQPGETLWAISNKYNIPVSTIEEMNRLAPGSSLSIGQELKIPASASASPTPVPSPTVKEQPVKEIKTHVVQPGDNLWNISKKYEVAVADIEKWNSMPSGSTLSVGQELIIQSAGKNIPEVKKEAISRTYTVQAGDSLYGIAKKFDITVDELKKLNGKTSNELSIGEELKVE